MNRLTLKLFKRCRHRALVGKDDGEMSAVSEGQFFARINKYNPAELCFMVVSSISDGVAVLNECDAYGMVTNFTEHCIQVRDLADPTKRFSTIKTPSRFKE